VRIDQDQVFRGKSDRNRRVLAARTIIRTKMSRALLQPMDSYLVDEALSISELCAIPFGQNTQPFAFLPQSSRSLALFDANRIGIFQRVSDAPSTPLLKNACTYRYVRSNSVIFAEVAPD